MGVDKVSEGEEVQSERGHEVQGQEVGRYYLPASFAMEKLRGPKLGSREQRLGRR